MSKIIAPALESAGWSIGLLTHSREQLFGINVEEQHPSLAPYPEVFDRALGESQRKGLIFLGNKAIIAFSQDRFGENRSLLVYDALNPQTHRRENIARCFITLSAWAAERVGQPYAGQRHTFEYDIDWSNPTLEYGVHPLNASDFAKLDQLQAQLKAD